jgi:hypothetical protein
MIDFQETDRSFAHQNGTFRCWICRGYEERSGHQRRHRSLHYGPLFRPQCRRGPETNSSNLSYGNK